MHIKIQQEVEKLTKMLQDKLILNMQIYFTQSFNSAEILERHSNGCFEINDKK